MAAREDEMRGLGFEYGVEEGLIEPGWGWMFGMWPSMAADDGAASTQPLMNREVGDELPVGWALPVHIKAQVHSR
ncbi:hypothetical protein CFC21_003900 [Triticum aestivum]|uniref:Uncharacterized protein n=1 Tax=Triticum aestivum TaxID=4565 RepID=A0A3B6NQX7_WHEAT|nr:hypothetical protein CFC21_003900 [Triticum aestivum]